MKPSFAKVTKTLRRWVEFDDARPGTSSGVSQESSPNSRPVIPSTTDELVQLLRLAPDSVISPKERGIIAAAMSFSDFPVARLMLPKTEMTFVKEDELLGPLVLDRLYKSGFSHFPVTSRTGDITGIISTSSLNSLAIKEAMRAGDLADPDLFYLRSDYTLKQALAVFLRTGSPFCLVVNKEAQIVGQLTLNDLLTHLLGELPEDDFDQDSDVHSVAARHSY